MNWIPVGSQLPKAFERVWIKVSTGQQTTGHVKSTGDWSIHCPRIAKLAPTVIGWRA